MDLLRWGWWENLHQCSLKVYIPAPDIGCEFWKISIPKAVIQNSANCIQTFDIPDHAWTLALCSECALNFPSHKTWQQHDLNRSIFIKPMSLHKFKIFFQGGLKNKTESANSTAARVLSPSLYVSACNLAVERTPACKNPSPWISVGEDGIKNNTACHSHPESWPTFPICIQSQTVESAHPFTVQQVLYRSKSLFLLGWVGICFAKLGQSWLWCDS